MSRAARPYAIEWAGPAKRVLRRLPEKVATSSVEFIYSALASDPLRVGRPLPLELSGKYSAHRGDYRVIYSIDGRRRVVIVEVIEHRADVYRPR